jgi:HPt (histidine-containing phosphotransfer) domain-containing protein
MDDYVAKPIRIEELVAALGRCQRRVERAPSVGRAVVTQLAESMGAAFVVELIDTFIDDGREQVGALRQALTANDVDTFRRAAHSLKSTSETLGAAGLAVLARELETLARGGSLDGADGRLGALAERYETVARELGDLRRELPA